MHSPTSITENNTIDVEVYRMRNKWKELYTSTKVEMEARTEKFDRSIGIFCCILKDMKKVMRDPKKRAE